MATFLTNPIAYLETILAQYATFRTWCGAATEAEAKSSHIFSFDAIADSAKPAKFVSISDSEWTMVRDAAGAGSEHFARQQRLEVFFFEDLGMTAWAEATTKTFLDNIANFVLELASKAESTGGFRISSITKKSWEESFQLRAVDDEDGSYAYQYGIIIDVSYS
jgi:hypothetical protein